MPSTEPKRIWRISRRLKEARAAAKPKISQSELARRVKSAGVSDMTPALASRLELGYTYATWPEVEAFAKSLNVEPNWLAEVEASGSTSTGASPEKSVAPKPAKPAAQPRGLAAASALISADATAASDNVKVAESVSTSPTPPPDKPAVVSPTPSSPPFQSSTAAPIPAPTAVALEPLTLPARGERALVDYRTLLVAERTKAEQTMSQRGIPPAEWRRWRDYARDLNEALRSLRD